VMWDGKQGVFGLRAGVDNVGKACRIRVFGGFLGVVWIWKREQSDVENRTIKKSILYGQYEISASDKVERFQEESV